MIAVDIPLRVAAKAATEYSVADNGCWISPRPIKPGGSAVISWRQRGVPGSAAQATRVVNAAWVHHHGPVPDGATIRQACGQLRCVNPAHLEIPVPRQLPPEEVTRLCALQEAARTVNGGTRADDPRRAASVQLSAELTALLEAGWNSQELGEVLGVSRAAVQLRVRRHGHLPNYPSQPTYLGRRPWDVAS